MNPFGTGAAPRPLDKRDFKLGYSQAPIQIPAVFMPNYSSLPVKMQGQYGTCGGHAGSAFESFAEMLDLSPKYLWKQIKTMDGYALDAGTDMRSIFKALQTLGDCHEVLLPNVLDSTLEAYSDVKTITDAQLNDAYPHGLSSYAFVENPSIEQIKQAIFQNKVVIARVDCGSGWYSNGWSESATCPLKLGTLDSGHFILLWGYDEKYIYFRNSWSNAWGRNGDGYFDVSYIPHVHELGTAIDGPSLKQQLISGYQTYIMLLQKKLVDLMNKLKTK